MAAGTFLAQQRRRCGGFSLRPHAINAGCGRVRQALLDNDAVASRASETLLGVHEALDRLALTNPQAAELVKLRYFAGCTNLETATLLGISPRKANQIWAYARAWLLDAI